MRIFFINKKNTIQNSKKCPKCNGKVKVETQICRFCNYEFPPIPKKEPEEPPPPITKEEIDNLWKKRYEIFKKVNRW
jgi:uncharacterized protein with PIN domain